MMRLSFRSSCCCPTIKNWLTADADIIPLIKPQFEAGQHDVGKGGVVRDSNVHARVLDEV